MSTGQVGQIVSTDPSNITHIEAGRRKLSMRQAVLLDDAWDTGDLFATMVDYAQSTHHPDWNREHQTQEAKAEEIRIFETLLIPGLLQTEEYSRAVFVAGRRPDVDAAVATRLARQEVMNKPNLHLWILLDECVLLRPVGGAEVFRRQLRHLLDITDQPYAVLRIIPLTYGEYGGMDGPITIFTQAGRDVAYTDARTGGRLVSDPGKARSLRSEFDMVGSDALSRVDSRRMIQEKVEAL